ncbi:hypothetical protein VPH35_005158 [Triticum aestivum]
MPAGVIDLNLTPRYSGAGQPSDGTQRKLPETIPSANMAGAHKLFEEMPLPTPMADDPDYAAFMENIIFESRGEAFHVDGQGQTLYLDVTQSQDGRDQYGDTQFAGQYDEDEDDHGNSWHEDDDLYCEDEEEEADIVDEPLVFIDELTQRTEAQKKRKIIRTGSYIQVEDTLICGSWMEICQDPAFQSLEAFKARHKNKPFTLTHCWSLIKDCPKFKDQYAARKKKGGKANVPDEGYLLKRPRGKTSSKADEKCDASSMALQGTLENMMSQKEVREERRSNGKEEQMKIYLELQTKKLDMEEAAKRRKLDIEEAAQLKKLGIEPSNADTKAKEAFQSLEAFKARHKNKPFTLTYCWSLIKDCPKFKDQYTARKKKGGKANVADEGDLLKRPRGKTSLKADEKRDASSMALQGTLENMTSQKEVREEKRSKGKEEQMKIYLELEMKKLDMEEAGKRRKLDIEEAAQLKKLEIEPTNANTRAKEVPLAIMSIDKSNMSSERKAWFVNRQKEMFARDGLN